MSLTTKLQTIAQVLGAVTIPTGETTSQSLKVGHYEYFGNDTPYCVWAESQEQSSSEGDNYKNEQAIQGTIDFYTKAEFDPFIDAIQDALKLNRISFYLNSVQYEHETGLIHYEWVFGI